MSEDDSCYTELGYESKAERAISCFRCNKKIIKNQPYFRGFAQLGNCRGSKSFHFECYLKLATDAVECLRHKKDKEMI